MLLMLRGHISIADIDNKLDQIMRANLFSFYLSKYLTDIDSFERWKDSFAGESIRTK